MSGRLLLFHYHLFLVSSLCSLALVLPDYSVSYIKATIGDTITQAKCKYPPEHHSPFSNSVESLGQAIAWAPGFYPKSPPQLNPVPSVHFTSLFWHLSLTSSGDVTAWFLSCGLSPRAFARRDDDPLKRQKRLTLCILHPVFLPDAPLCACLPSRPLSCGFWERKVNIKCPSIQESPHSSCTIFLFKASGVE